VLPTTTLLDSLFLIKGKTCLSRPCVCLLYSSARNWLETSYDTRDEGMRDLLKAYRA
jgi:hypothetical protein